MILHEPNLSFLFFAFALYVKMEISKYMYGMVSIHNSRNTWSNDFKTYSS